MPIIAAVMVPHPPLIIPEVGKGEEKQVQKTIDAYDKAGRFISELKPDTIIVSSPHSVMYSDYFHISPGKKAKGSFSRFAAPQVSFEEEYDEELVKDLCERAEAIGFPAGILGERDASLDHGTMVPLHFIEKYYKDFRLVRVSLSGLSLSDNYRFGQLIQQSADHLGRRAVFVGSGDLSHKLQKYGPYGFDENGPVYDKRIMDVMSKADFGELFDFDELFLEKAAECGHRSFVIMAGALDGIRIIPEFLVHEDVTGVGYGICTYKADGEDENCCYLERHENRVRESLKEKMMKEDPYVSLARRTIETYVKEDRKLKVPEDLEEEMLKKKAGTFVSIHKEGMLRGCIGTIFPTTDCLAQEIINNAISACSRDPRFTEVREDELPYLEISVDVLSETEEVSSLEELDEKRYGVIVSNGYRQGVLLPDLEGVGSVKEQIAIARRKAGIDEDEDISIERFEVVRHG
ncbi:MAG: AmmeMemoRadiSam system protein A [Erysipelotrichaceae bacterium]|nr:AmmeMemoRadiSam system protein A [Erysipelotrichaceae bacterium]